MVIRMVARRESQEQDMGVDFWLREFDQTSLPCFEWEPLGPWFYGREDEPTSLQNNPGGNHQVDRQVSRDIVDSGCWAYTLARHQSSAEEGGLNAKSSCWRVGDSTVMAWGRR